jgi:hypothetical protein
MNPWTIIIISLMFTGIAIAVLFSKKNNNERFEIDNQKKGSYEGVDH